MLIEGSGVRITEWEPQNQESIRGYTHPDQDITYPAERLVKALREALEAIPAVREVLGARIRDPREWRSDHLEECRKLRKDTHKWEEDIEDLISILEDI